MSTSLFQIVGVRGVPLIYLIHEEDIPTFNASLPYNEAVINAMTLTGQEFQ